MRVTDDNRVRHEILPNGPYIEARGQRERAYEGYEVGGTHIDYRDDTGSLPTPISSIPIGCTMAA